MIFLLINYLIPVIWQLQSKYNRVMKVRLMMGLLFLFVSIFGFSQTGYWQQKVEYTMNIDFDVSNHQFKGTQKLVYYNNSPDTLTNVFYHLYFNAFQPQSMMDIRSRTIEDPDKRVGSRIYNLQPEEIGYHNIHWIKRDGKGIDFNINGTILEISLKKPLLPGKKTIFEMEFASQVPIQIRRSGRDNKEGIDYTMTQWYPKMVEYDQDGWHSNPYIGREFHGVWGDFDVTINIDSSYTIGGSGVLQNPYKVGHGYVSGSKADLNAKLQTTEKFKWNFRAEDVHDFAWAADPDFKHDIVKVPDGPELHFLYQTDTLVENWERVQSYAVESFQMMNKTFGKYPYEQYSIIQAGDGGMEYPMCTMIASHSSLGSLISVIVHESIHSWYQGVLATNESKYPWMDEGFTTFAQRYILDKLYKSNRLNPLAGNYGAYYRLIHAGKQEPLTTHADHYITNSGYGTSSYSKGGILLHQLSYIVGEETFFKGMRRYFNEWKFKHPTADDFKRVMEKTSGLELDWYFEHWVGTTNTIDYGIKYVIGDNKKTKLTLEKIGEMPMPLDVYVKLKNGSLNKYYIPLRMMRGEKNEEKEGVNTVVSEDWPWTYPEYELTIDYSIDQIEAIEIDYTTRMADVDRSNNTYPTESSLRFVPKNK